MNLRQASGGVSLTVLLLATAFTGCGASGGSTAGSGGQVSAAGDTSTGGQSDPSTSENTGGAPAVETTATGGNTPLGGANATGGKVATGGAPTTGGRTGTGGAPVVRCNSDVTVSGCTPGQLTQTGTLSGQYQTYNATVGSKQYFLQVNEWGSSATQTMSYGGSYFFKMTQQQANMPTDNKPAGYPSMFIGANSNHTTANSGLPKQVSALGKVLTTWNWADNGTTADSTANIFNAAYDVWFSTNGAEAAASGPSGGYLMVWYYAQNCQPVGSMTEAGHLVAGMPGCWDVWTGTNNGKPVISYKRQGIVSSLGYDLNLFIQDALKNFPTYMKSTWYLTNIFTGFEIWKGGVNLESTSFCAEVN